MLRQKYKAPLSIKSPELRTKGNVDIKGRNYSKGLNKQDVNLTDRLLAVYRVRRSGVDKKRQTEVISKMLEANQVLYLELQIVRFW